MAAEEVVAAYASLLFIRSEAEIRRPVVLLTGERTNVYGVLEKHFRETALPPSERFWRTVRTQWTPQLDTWRPRVNGVQLKVLAGARLPESEEEWAAVRSALLSVRQHLRTDTSVDRLHGELRDFVAMVVDWWHNRKKAENCGTVGGGLCSGVSLIHRVTSTGLLMGGGNGMQLSKKPRLDFMQLAPIPQALPQTGPPPVYQSTIYAAPEIMPHALLTNGGGSAVLPPRAALAAAADDLALQPHQQQAQAQAHNHLQQQLQADESGYLQHLPNHSDAHLFGHLFPVNGSGGAGGAAAAEGNSNGRGSQSPRDGAQQGSGLLAPMDGSAGGAGGGGGGSGGYYPHSPLPDRREESADNRELARAIAPSAADSKLFVTLNVGGHRFLTTAATLAAVDGSYFAKLAQQAAAAAAKNRGGGGSEYFVDRSGKMFEYVLDYLRSQRFSDSPSTLPRDERTLQLLAREADFYQLHDLADRARSALLATAAPAAPAPAPAAGLGGFGAGYAGEETPSDMPANIAAEGSAHGGGRLGGYAAMLAAQQAQHGQQQQAAAAVLDALFVETGFQPAAALAEAQAGLLQQLNATMQAKQAGGFTVVSFKCGTEREGECRNLHYHVLLRKPGTA